ncbi:MAG TPA: hypothetical protein VJT31_22045, partial [Rugosimonospora sp.]|nr:hypothetical protein [Rugosimonospora sp.]
MVGTLAPWRDAVARLHSTSPLLQPSAVPGAVNAAVRDLGVYAHIYLIDREQRTLRRLPETPGPAPAP